MNVDPQLIEQLLIGVQSHDSNTRKSSEFQLNSLSESHVDDVASGLLNISIDASKPVELRQGGLFILKSIILKAWSIGFDQFTGSPVISTQLKSHIRSQLLSLIGDSETKVRSAVALLVSKLASVEFPDEWPELIDILQKNLLVPEKNVAVDDSTFYLLEGTLAVLSELLNDALSETEFFKIGNSLLSSLLKVLLLYSSRKSDINSWKLCVLVIQCFSACIQFFLMAEETQLKALEDVAKKIINEWSKPFFDLLSAHTHSHAEDDVSFYNTNLAVAIIDTKIDILAALRELDSAFPFFSQETLPQFFNPVWEDWKLLSKSYRQINSSSLSEASSQAIINIIVEQIAFLQTSLESNDELLNILSNNQQLFQEFISISTIYASIPDETRILWYENCNEFITQERELSLDRSPRTEIIQLILALESNPLLLSLIWSQARGETGDPVSLESTLHLLDCTIKEISLSQQKIDSTFITSLINTLTTIQERTDQVSPIDVLIKSRAIMLGSTISKYFGGRIDTLTVRLRFLNNSLQAASGENIHPTLKLSSLIALDSYSKSLTDSLKPYQNILFSSIASLTNEIDSDTPAMLVEFLLSAINLDSQSAIINSSSDILTLLFSLASKDTSNIELVTEVQEMLEEFVENATNLQLYDKISAQALPLLLTNINNSTQGIYSSDLMLSLNLIGSLIDKGPPVLGEEMVVSTIVPLYRIIEVSEDAQILQAASEAFTFLVEHGFNQLANTTDLIDNKSGVELILLVASKLLDPSWEDSAALASGRLVTVIINKFGGQLGDLLPKLLDATVRRLVNAENLSLVENLVSVFCLLVIRSPEQVVDVLSNIILPDQNKTALDAVLVKWLSSFEYVRGYDEIKRNVIALEKLYSLNDSRVKTVITEGDLETPEGDIIITRSKAKALKYKQISADEKIIKLLIKELATTPNAGESADANADEDDEWEDEFTGSTVPSGLLNEYSENSSVSRQLDTETYSIILEWFKQIAYSNTGDFHAIYGRLTKVEQEILRDKLHGTP